MLRGYGALLPRSGSLTVQQLAPLRPAPCIAARVCFRPATSRSVVAHVKGRRRRQRRNGVGGEDDEDGGSSPTADPAVAQQAALFGGMEGSWVDDQGFEEEDDNIILIGASDDESSDENDRAALRRFVQQSEDPRFKAALLAAQQAFADAETRGADAAGGWEAPEDDEDGLPGQGGATGPGGLGSFSDYEGPLTNDDDADDRERVFLVGVMLKSEQQAAAAAAGRRRWRAEREGAGEAAAAASVAGDGWWREASSYTIEESLEELGRLAETAGLKVVGSTFQTLESPNNATYIGSGKVAEVARAVASLGADTVIFDEELSPGQLRNLEKAFSGEGGRGARVADRTALILDIFSQRARTREGMLQVELAQTDYQLPRLTRMWTHLDRVGGGGQVKGAGEKQIEIDKRLLREKAAGLRKELQEVRRHRAAHRERRGAAPIPVVALVGYTNAGKSTLMNTLTQAGVLAEDKLFATLDPTTRKVRLRNNLEVLFSDTVGFIQKLPPQLVAAFTATLEEIADAGVVLHVMDASAINAVAQCDAVLKVLDDLKVHGAPIVTAWNKIDACTNPDAVRALAAGRSDTVVISGVTGEGVGRLLEVIADTLAASMADMELLLPYSAGDLLDDLHKTGSVRSLDYEEAGARVSAAVPRHLAGKLAPYSVGAGAAAPAAAAAAAGGGLPFEDGAGDGSLWVESSGGWSDDDDEEVVVGVEGARLGFPLGPLKAEEDEELAAARRHLEALEAAQRQKQQRDGQRQRRGRRGEGGEGEGTGEGRRLLFAHRLPAEWEEVVLGGGGGGAGFEGADSRATHAAGIGAGPGLAASRLR